MKLLKLVPGDTNIKFLRFRVPFFIISLVLMAASWGLVAVNGLNLGIDFAGGQKVEISFEDGREVPTGDLRQLVEGLGYGEPLVQEVSRPVATETGAIIRVPLPENVEAGAANEIGDRVIAEIQEAYPNVRADGNETVSGKVAEEFSRDAGLALLAAMVMVALYIWIRFEWQFGVGALFALFHDVTLTLGLFSLFQLEFSLQIIAAILAIIGYSLNDTIVVYDRIRENLKKYRKMPLAELLDLSINETLARTVMTSLTLLVALLPLLIAGPASLFGLVAAIVFGLFVGTYSSVYMASPLLLWMGVTSDSFVPKETEADRQEKKVLGEA